MAIARSNKRNSSNERMRCILECAENLAKLINERSALPTALVAELKTIIKKQELPVPHTDLSVEQTKNLENLGVSLWNASTSISCSELSDEQAPLIRLFALLLLQISHVQSLSIDPTRRVRLLRTALRTAQLCLDRSQLEHALVAFEISSDHIGAAVNDEPALNLSTAEDASAEDTKIMRKLINQYYLLRVVHAWKLDRLDLAQLFYAKIDVIEDVDDAELCEQAADLYDKIARSLAQTSQLAAAQVWFERALMTLETREPENLNQEMLELMTSIRVTYAATLLQANEPQAVERCRTLVQQLDQSHEQNGRVVISTLKLQVELKNVPANAQVVNEILLQMCEVPLLTDRSFMMILQSMQQASQIVLDIALKAMRSFIILRLLPECGLAEEQSENVFQTWLEKATVAFVLFCTIAISQDGMPSVEVRIQDLLDTVYKNFRKPFSTPATHAAQALIWKSHPSADAGLHRVRSELLRHPLFENAGLMNKGRIARSIMNEAIAKEDFALAREAFFWLPAAARNECSTRYLAFTIGLCDRDAKLAEESLSIITQAADKNPSFLYACALAAQKSEMRVVAITVMQTMIDRKTAGVHLPSLLRCTARLLMAECEGEPKVSEQRIRSILEVFEVAARSKHEIRSVASAHWSNEAQWWSKNAYNIALQYCDQIHPQYLIRLLAVCDTFLDCNPHSDDPQRKAEIWQRRLTCSFLSATACIVQARKQDTDEQTMTQSYRDVQDHINAFDKIYGTGKMSITDNLANQQLRKRAFQMLRFRLESVLRLQQWSKARDVLRCCLDFENVGRWDTLVDLLLISHDQISTADPGATETVIEILQRAINETWKVDKNLARLARWIRIAFTICLDREGGQLSLRFAEQAAVIAEGGQKNRHEQFPAAELHWLASTSFNRAVDYFATGNSTSASGWVEAALGIARWADDNGTLHAMLTARRDMAQERLVNRYR